jgi:hypothetical protein
VNTIVLLGILFVVAVAPGNGAIMDEEPNILDSHGLDSHGLASHWQYSDSFGPTDPSNRPAPLGIQSTWAATLVNPGAVTLHGPELFGSQVSGFGILASNSALDCSTARCSAIVLVDTSPSLLVTELELVADGPIVIGNALGSMTLERGRIELSTDVTATLSTTGEHVVGAGTAHFTVIGEVDGEVRRTAATNSTRIALIRDSVGWQTSSFDVGVVDEQGQRWIVSIPASHWR